MKPFKHEASKGGGRKGRRDSVSRKGHAKFSPETSKKRITPAQDAMVMKYLKGPLEEGKINEDELFVFLSEFNKLSAIARHEERSVERMLHEISQLRVRDEEMTVNLRRIVQETSTSERVIHDLQIQVDAIDEKIHSLHENTQSQIRTASQLVQIRDQERNQVLEWKSREKKVKKMELTDLGVEHEGLEKEENMKSEEIIEIENRIRRFEEEFRSVIDVEIRRRIAENNRVQEEINILSEEPGRLKKQILYFELKIERLVKSLTLSRNNLDEIEKEVSNLNNEINVRYKEEKFRLKTEIGNFDSLILKSQEKIRLLDSQIDAIYEHQAFILERTMFKKKEKQEIELMKREVQSQWKEVKRRDTHLRFTMDHLKKRSEHLSDSMGKLTEEKNALLLKKDHLCHSFKEQKGRLDDLEDSICLQIQKYLLDQKQAKKTNEIINLHRQTAAKVDMFCGNMKEADIQMSQLQNQLSESRQKLSQQIHQEKMKFVEVVSQCKKESNRIGDLRKKVKRVSRMHAQQELFLQKGTMQKTKYQQLLQETEHFLRIGKEEKRILKYESKIQSRKVFEREKLRLHLRKQFNDVFRKNEKLRKKQADRERKLEVLKDKTHDLTSQILQTEGYVQKNESRLVSLRDDLYVGRTFANVVGQDIVKKNDLITVLREKTKMEDVLIRESEIELEKKVTEHKYTASQLKNLEEIDLPATMKAYQKHLEYQDMYHDLCLHEETLNTKISNEKKRLNDTRNPICQIRFVQSVKRREGSSKQNTSNEEGIFDKEILKNQILKLRSKVQKKREYLMERQIILNELTKASDRLRRSSIDWRNYMLTNSNLAVGLNVILSKIRKQDRRMKSLLSEISIHDAQLIGLKIQNKEVRNYYKNVAKHGDQYVNCDEDEKVYRVLNAPERRSRRRSRPISSTSTAPYSVMSECDEDSSELEIQNEVKQRLYELKSRKKRTKDLKKQMKRDSITASRKKRNDEEFNKSLRTKELSTSTTAMKRPNCYVPDHVGSLGLPKPYLGFAPPVMPLKTGSSMRFIKKPKKNDCFDDV